MREEIKRAIELLQQKDPKNLDEALALLQNTVYSFSMKICGQRQDAEDTMQEVLLKSLPYLPKFDSPKALLVWIYKVAKNRCLMSRRRSKFASKEDLSLDELMPELRELQNLTRRNDGTPETLLMRREGARRLRAAVQKLPPEYRLILVLHDMEELSDADVAEITGLRLGTIRVRLHRARLYVRKEFDRQDQHRIRLDIPKPAVEKNLPSQPRQRRCKEMFAELSNYLDGELDDSLCEELEKHMDGCEPCKAFLSSLEESIQQCRQAPDESPDPSLTAKLRRDLLSEYQGLMARITKQNAKAVSQA